MRFGLNFGILSYSALIWVAVIFSGWTVHCRAPEEDLGQTEQDRARDQAISNDRKAKEARAGSAKAKRPSPEAAISDSEYAKYRKALESTGVKDLGNHFWPDWVQFSGLVRQKTGVDAPQVWKSTYETDKNIHDREVSGTFLDKVLPSPGRKAHPIPKSR